MQINAGDFHNAENAGKNEGDAAGYDETGAETETDEADEQDDDDRFAQ